MSLTDRDVQDILVEYIEHHHEMSHDVAYHLVKAAEACATVVSYRAEMPKIVTLDFPEITSLAQFYTHVDPRRKTIFSDRLSSRTFDEIKFRHFYKWLDEKANSDDWGKGRKVALRDALVGTDAYEKAFPKVVAIMTDDVEYGDEDRCEADYADEYVRDA